eukprot:GHVP01023315.1.p2 GENE.GHVP01023315.1~~GHVP01023315.1.p2  ORF type:complete len:123 (+),score=20.25 GHVP01023315.1:126-494(+)
MFHNLTVQSLEAVASTCSAGENRTQLTDLLCPLHVPRRVPSSLDQTLALLSADDVATNLSLGLSIVDLPYQYNLHRDQLVDGPISKISKNPLGRLLQSKEKTEIFLRLGEVDKCISWCSFGQ